MPCENLAKLCPTCLDLASKCSEKIAAEYIPVNSLRHPADTKPFILEFDTTTTFDMHAGGKLIGQSLRDLLEPHLKTTGDDGTSHVRRFHMWIRRYTEAERTAKSTSEPASLPLPVIKYGTTMTDPASGHVVNFLQRSPKLYEECHDSLYRLMWFHELVKNQPCAPYMFWSNFVLLPRSETKPANAKVEPWFIWRAEHPTTPTGKVAGA